MRFKIVFLIVISAVLLFSIEALPQNILVWKNVGKSSFISPETGALVTADFGIKLALSLNARTYDATETLPEDISNYDLIFITLGFPVDCG